MAGVRGRWRRHLVVAVSLMLVLQSVATTPAAATSKGIARATSPSAPEAAPEASEPTTPGPLADPGDLFQTGDVLVATGTSIQWRKPDWTLKSTLSVGGTVGDMAFDGFGNLYATDVSNGRVRKFNSAGASLGTFASGMNQPSGIDVDSGGNVVVGERVTSVVARVFKFDPEGTKLGEWQQPGGRTAFYGDLASDDCTFRYVPNTANWVGTHLFTLDVCSGAFDSVGTAPPVDGSYYQLNGLPDDEMLIVFASVFGWSGGGTGVVRYPSSGGSPLQLYTVGNPQANDPWLLRAVAGDPVNGWLWTGTTSACGSVGCETGGRVWRVDLASGAELSTHTTGTSTILAMEVVPAPPGPPEDPPPDGTEDNPPDDNQADAGDPVSTLTGAFHDTRVDVAIPGRGPGITFTRAYNSNDPRVTTLGPGWTHSYNIRLVSPGDETNDLVLVGPQGRSDRYVESGGSYTPPAGVDRSLVQNPDETYTAVDKEQLVWEFDVSGRLTQIRDRFGNVSNLTYDEFGRVATVSDPAGRGSLTLTHVGGRLSTVTDWATPARTVTFQYDANGRLWKFTNREGKTTTYAYEGSSHRIASITNARNNTVLTLTYDAQGRVATQKDARGLVTGDATTFDYVVNPDATRETTVTALPTSHEPSFSPSLTDSYDANGWLVARVTRPSSTETLTQSFTYNAAGDRTSVTDPRGHTTDFCYDVDFAGNPLPGSEGNLTRRIEPPPTTGADRPVTLIAYDAKDNVIQTVAPAGVPSGETVTCATDLSTVDPAFVVDFTYDAAEAALLATTIRFTDPEFGLRTAVTKYEYGDATNPGLVTRVIPPRGNTGPSPDYTYATTLSYYATGANAGLLKDVTDPLGDKTSYAYDPVGRLTSSVDPLGNAAGAVPAEHTTTLAYDNEDRLRFRTLPAPLAGGYGLTDETRYDAVGNPIVRIDANGQVTTSAYDARNSLASVTESTQVWTDPAAPPSAVIVTEYDHDAVGNVTRVTRASGDSQNERVTERAYDGRGLFRTETQYPNWPSTSGSLATAYAYDANGNRLNTTDPLGQVTTHAYDALNRLTGIDYSDAATPDVALTYDANGNRTSMTDGIGTTTYVHDEADRLVAVISPGPTTVGYRYDLDGNRTKLIYPDATAVIYAFDKAGQLSSLTDWASRSVSHAYFPDGLVRTASNPDGSVATYIYDNARRLVDILHTGPNGAVLDRFAYTLDAAGNVTDVANGSLEPQFARPDGFVGSNGTWTGTYASIDEPTASDADFLASPSGPTTSNYYEVSLSDVAEPHVPTGITARYRYAKSGNNSGKVTNLTVELRQGSTVIASQSHTNIPGVTGSGWQAGSFTLTATQASAITDFADLRLRFRPSSGGGGQSRSAQVSWAEVELASAGDPATLITYSYDRLYRLTDVEDATDTASYTYDPVGNRLTADATTFTHDRADRMTSAGATSITVDANGNLTAKAGDTFAFDQANRLTSATVQGVIETYEYDGDGTRVSHQTGSDPAIDYVSDVVGGLPVMIGDGNRKYVYGLGLAYAVTGSSIEVYHTDRLGSVRSLTDGVGSVVATYETDAWGVPTETSGSSSQPFGFTGEPRDATGLSYLRARYYDPDLGRFLSRDTWAGRIGSPSSLNRFAYAEGNPTTHADPSGHCVVDVIGDLAFVGWDLLSLTFGPEKERDLNLLALGADAAALGVPCLTGAGFFVRGGVHFISGGGKILEGARAIRAAASRWGLDYKKLSAYIERELKPSWGLGAADNVRILPNGDIVPPIGDDVLGNVFDILE